MDGAGTPCSYSTCRLHDFLPIPCPGCHQSFCRDHALPHEHGCISLATAFVSTTSQYVAARRCDLSGCSEKAMLGNIYAEGEDALVKCQACKGAFCVTHRAPPSHACSSSSQSAPAAPSRAQKLLAKNFPSTASSAAQKPVPSRKPPTDPAKLKQYLAVQLMKMRHSAKPLDEKDAKSSIAVGDRLHLKLRILEQNSKEEVLWFRKTLVAGRALDVLATRFKLPHEPGSPDLTRILSLVVPVADPDGQESTASLDLNMPLDGQVPDGGELWIKRGN